MADLDLIGIGLSIFGLIITMVVIIAIGFIAFQKLPKKLKEVSNELIPYPKTVDLIALVLGTSIILLAINSAFSAISQSGFFVGDLSNLIAFISTGATLGLSTISKLMDLLYFIAIIFVGYCILQISKKQ